VNRRRSLNIQALALVIGSGVAQLLVAALYILTARSMRPDEYGPVVTAIGLGIAGAGFIDLGSSAYWIRELASVRITQDELNARMSMRFLLTLAIAGLVSIAALIAAPAFFATGVLLFTTCAVQTVLVPLRAERRAEAVAWLTVLGRLAAIAIFLGQFAIGFSPGLALWTSLALGDVALIVCALAVTPAVDRLGLSVRSMSNPWSGSRWYAVSVMSTSAAQLDLPLVAALGGPVAAGIYGGVNRWTQPVLVATGAFAQATAPFIAAAPRLMALRKQLIRASWILLLAIAISIAVFVSAPWLVRTLLGDDFSDSAPVLRLLALAMLLNTVTQPLTVALQSRRFDQVAALLVVATAATHLIITAVLVPSQGALGAGIGMLAAQSVALVGTVVAIALVARRRGRFG
jgi:O-antigen/teichoic acid export membrane protein